MNHKLSVFKFYLITYLIIVLIPILSSVFLYTKLLHIIETDNQDKYQSLLVQSQQSISQYLNEINNIPKQILLNTSAYSFLTADVLDPSSENYNPLSVSSAQECLRTYTGVNFLLDHIYLYSGQSDMFLDPATTIDATQFYGDILQVGGYGYQDLRNQLLGTVSYNRIYPELPVKINENSRNMILHVTTTPLWERRHISGSILIMIERDSLIRPLKEAIPSGYCYFYDADQTLITQSPEAPPLSLPASGQEVTYLSGVKYMVYATTEENNCNFAVAVPYSEIDKSLGGLRRDIYIFIALCLLVSTALALYFTKINSRPVQNLARSLLKYSAAGSIGKHEYTFISDAVDQLISSDANLRSELQKTQPILQSNFVHSLIEGTLVSPSDIRERISQLGTDLTADSYIVMIVSLLGLKPFLTENVTTLASAKQAVRADFTHKVPCLCTDLQETDLVFIAYFKNEDMNENLLLIEQTTNQISRAISEQYGLQLKAALGTPCTKLTDIFYSYQAAKEYLNFGIQTPFENTIWCVKNVIDSAAYYYPVEVEQRLILAFKSGNLKIVDDILDMIVNENTEKRILPGVAINYLYSDVKSTLYKLSDKLGAGVSQSAELEKLLKKLDTSLSIPDFFGEVKKVTKELHGLLTDDHSENLQAAMLHFVEFNYKDPTLSRQSFAQHFRISEDYTSKFFKQHTGYNFSEYVVRVRMEAACKLIAENKYKVEQIATAVGYNNDISFRRAFKAYTGMTPREYKKMN